MKICTKCGIQKSLDAFHRDRRKSSGYRPSCKTCCRAASREYHHRADRAIKRHGVSVEQFQDLLDSQQGRCALCGMASQEPLRLDHDHSCCPGNYSCGKCVRGLLCRCCNVGLGQFQDDPNLLRSAERYLRSFVV